jgi:conjugal transfer pilus assembly protein TraE
MELKRYINEKAKAKGENRLLKLFVIIVGVATLINTLVMFRALSYQRVVIMPPNLDGKTVIQGNRLDDMYVSSFIRYINDLAFNYTPGSAHRQFDELLLHFSPAYYPSGKITFYNLADQVGQSKVTQAYVIDRITVNNETKKVTLDGTRRQYIDDRKIEDGKKQYFVDYEIADGRMLITSIKESKDEGVK